MIITGRKRRGNKKNKNDKGGGGNEYTYFKSIRGGVTKPNKIVCISIHSSHHYIFCLLTSYLFLYRRHDLIHVADRLI
jgi:hypothetical protein